MRGADQVAGGPGPDASLGWRSRGLDRRSLLCGAAVGAVGAALYLPRGMVGAAESEHPARPAPLSNELTSALRYMTPAEAEAVSGGRGEIDVTAACQRALDASSRVHFPKGVYLVDADVRRCLKVRSGQTITLDKGAIIKAMGNALAHYQVLSIEKVRDVSISGGVVVGERTAHLGRDGEHGMGIGIYDSTDVVLRNITVKDCWGDGIYVGGRGFEGRSERIRIENCRTENNRRQGLTISAVDICTVAGGRFAGTNGIAPAAGIDIEPNHGEIWGISKRKAGVSRVVIAGVECSGNEGHGITVSQVHTRDVEIRDAVAQRNGMSGISCGYPGSDVRIIAPDCRDNGDHGIEVFGDPAYITRGIRIERPICVANRKAGIFVRRNVEEFIIFGGTVAENGEHGIACDGTGGSTCGDGVIERVAIRANSQAASAGFDNVYIGPQCRRIRVSGNTISSGTKARKPRYGVNVAAGKDIVIANNDLRAAGSRANVSGLDRPGVAWQANRI